MGRSLGDLSPWHLVMLNASTIRVHRNIGSHKKKVAHISHTWSLMYSSAMKLGKSILRFGPGGPLCYVPAAYKEAKSGLVHMLDSFFLNIEINALL